MCLAHFIHFDFLCAGGTKDNLNLSLLMHLGGLILCHHNQFESKPVRDELKMDEKFQKYFCMCIKCLCGDLIEPLEYCIEKFHFHTIHVIKSLSLPHVVILQVISLSFSSYMRHKTG